MTEPINEKVSVSMYYDRLQGTVMPYLMRWQGRLFKPNKLGYHHKTYEGRTLVHYFHVSNGSMAFRLKLNTDSLIWTLVEVSDNRVN
jgi:hypothetical protein